MTLPIFGRQRKRRPHPPGPVDIHDAAVAQTVEAVRSLDLTASQLHDAALEDDNTIAADALISIAFEAWLREEAER